LRNIYAEFLDELKKNNSLTLATIIETKGSTPQIPGASAIFSPDGLCAGTVGGGLLEGDAQTKALQSLQQEASLLYKFDLTSDISPGGGSICGGEATILIDAHPQDHTEVFQSVSKSLSQRQPGVLATFISRDSEEQISLARYWVVKGENSAVDSGMPHAKFAQEIGKSLAESKPNLLKIEEDTSLYLEPIYPLPHLIIVGAGHIGQALSHLGGLLDFEVTVIDDRPEFNNKEKHPEADNIIVDDIGKAVRDANISSHTYMVLVSQGHKSDAYALRQCIGSKAAYIGMLGSARKVRLIREQFLQEAWATTAQFDRIYAPIGIDTESETVQEIAVSIAAQLAIVRRQKRNNPEDTT